MDEPAPVFRPHSEARRPDSRSSGIWTSPLSFKSFHSRAVLPHLHLPHRFTREIAKQIRGGNTECLRESHENRQARDFQPQLQVADVVAGEVGGFGESFLGQAAFFPELAKTVPEKFCFLHSCIPHCRWNKVFQRALESAFSSESSRESHAKESATMPNVSAIRSLFLSPRPAYRIPDVAALLAITEADVAGWIDAGELEGLDTPEGLVVPWAEVVSFGMDFWSQVVVEEALGTDVIDLIPEMVRLTDLEVRIPRLQVVTLERLAAIDGETISAVLARELRDLVSVHAPWLGEDVPGFAAAFAWPETYMGRAG